MAHPPLTTGMERIKILTDLRSKDVKLPRGEGEDGALTEDQKTLLKWLLDHDPAKRPTSAQLLQSHFLPPPQVEEAEEVIRRTLANPKAKAYRYIGQIQAFLSVLTKTQLTEKLNPTDLL